MHWERWRGEGKRGRKGGRKTGKKSGRKKGREGRKEQVREGEGGEKKRDGLVLFLITCTLYTKRAWGTTFTSPKSIGVTPSNYPFPVSRTAAL